MKRFTVVNNGYDMDEVNRFIDIVINRLEQLNNEKANLSEMIEKLKNEEIEYNEKIEELNSANNELSTKIDNLNSEKENLTKTIDELHKKQQEEPPVSSKDINKLEKAILAVQETSDRIQETAREEARVIVEEAKNNANSIIHEALLNSEKIEHEKALLESNVITYKKRVRALLESQLTLIDELDNIEV